MKLKFISPVLLSIVFFAFYLFSYTLCSAQVSPDTLRVMAYNTLGFGTAVSGNCQAPAQADLPPLYADLKAIVKFANADIIGLDKMQCVQTSLTDYNGISGVYFPDTVIADALDAAYSGRYAFCPFTDLSDCNDGTSDLIFYDQTKLAWLSTTPVYTGAEDFDMVKLYYKEWFGAGADTTYLYVILCHTADYSDVDPTNSGEDSIVMNKLRALFPTALPNLIYMGDFNTHASTDNGYAYITQSPDATYNLEDPPFHPDGHLTYPDDWNSGTGSQSYFTTSTRTTTTPNSCGTTGGAKDWYDHIFLSPWIVDGTNNLTYVKDSYTTIGNNGNRAGLDVNDSTTHGFNTSAPDDVVDALFNFSDKYPVEVTLAVNPALGMKNIQSIPGSIKVNNPVENSFVLHFDSFLIGQNVTMGVYDVCGRLIFQSTFNVTNPIISKDIVLSSGVYMLHFISGGYSVTLKVVKE